MNRSRGIGLLLLLAVAALVVAGRLVLLYHSEFVFDEEEYKTGSIAALVMEGPQLPLLEYQPGDYEGGTLLFGLLTIPFFALLGKKYLALKLLALATTLITALLATWYARRHSGLAGGVATGALFVLPAAYVLQIGLLPWGNYAENVMLSLVALAIASRLFGRTRAAWPYLPFGALLGLSVWVHYGFAVTGLLLTILWWTTRPRGTGLRQALAAAVGAVIGFSPWIVYNATHHWWGVGRFADGVSKTSGVGSRLWGGLRRLGSLLWEDIAAGLHFHAAQLSTVKLLSYTYYVVVLALAIALVVQLREPLGRMLRALRPGTKPADADEAFWSLAPPAFVVLYALVYSFSDYGLFSREWGTLDPETHAHIFALYPMLLLSAGLAVGQTWATRWRTATVGGVVVLLALGVVGFWGLLTPDRPQAERLARPAFDRGVIYMEIGSKWGADPQEQARLQRQLSGHPLRAFVHGAGIRYGLDHAGSLPVALDKCAAQPAELLPYCLFGVGTGLYAGGALPPEQTDAIVRAAADDVRPWLILGGCVGNIWVGDFDHWSCVDAANIDVAALSPAGERQTLSVFVAGHLAMLQFRPDKQ